MAREFAWKTPLVVNLPDRYQSGAWVYVNLIERVHPELPAFSRGKNTLWES